MHAVNCLQYTVKRKEWALKKIFSFVLTSKYTYKITETSTSM